MSSSSKPVVIVGSGFFGSTLARLIAERLRRKVLLLEKRRHIGGNCYSETSRRTGIECHLYGSHIFHTTNPEVWSFVNRFSPFNHYRHKVLAMRHEQVYPMPICLATVNAFYGQRLTPAEAIPFLRKEAAKARIRRPRNFEEQAISQVGRPLYEAFLHGYTSKQWGREPRELPASILKRIPFRSSYDNDYFHDPHQGIPTLGYGRLFENLLDHPVIDLRLNTDFFKVRDSLPRGALVIHSGPIDRFFDYRFGRLPWRTIEFERETLPLRDYQGTAVMNFVEASVPYTRIHEFKHLHPERKPCNTTLVFREFSREKRAEEDEYYPIPTPANHRLYRRYAAEAARLPNVLFGGRLGSYGYLDMDDAVAAAMDLFRGVIVRRLGIA